MVAVEGGYQRSVLSIFHHSSKQFLLIKKMAPLTFHQLYAKVNFCCCLRYGRYKELTTLYGLIAARHVTEKEHTSDSVFVEYEMFKQQSLDRKQFFNFLFQNRGVSAAPEAQDERLQLIWDKIAARAELLSRPQRFSGSRALTRREMEIEKALFHGSDRSSFLTALYHQGRKMKRGSLSRQEKHTVHTYRNVDPLYFRHNLITHIWGKIPEMVDLKFIFFMVLDLDCLLKTKYYAKLCLHLGLDKPFTFMAFADTFLWSDVQYLI